MADRINFDKRTESKKYLIKINGLEDFEGHMTEFTTSSSYRTEITGTIKYTSESPVTINLIRIFDAESGLEVAYRRLSYGITMNNGESMDITYTTTVGDNTREGFISS